MLQEIALSNTRKNAFTDVALEKVLDSNLSAKYALKGCLSKCNIPELIHYSHIIGARHAKRSLLNGYDTDLSEFDSADIIGYILRKSVSYQKKNGCGHHPSFGMTPTQAIRARDLFA